jgi:hypothetical protein
MMSLEDTNQGWDIWKGYFIRISVHETMSNLDYSYEV